MRIDSNKFHPVGLEADIFVMKSLHDKAGIVPCPRRAGARRDGQRRHPAARAAVFGTALDRTGRFTYMETGTVDSFPVHRKL
jgi:hypothetical protein